MMVDGEELSINACCRFCNKADSKSIQVICGGKCLICSRCQLIPNIKNLFTEHSVFEQMPGNPTEFKFVSGSCPLCEKDLTIGMKSIIRSIKLSNYRVSSSTDELKRTTSIADLEKESNEVFAFFKRFRNTYELDNKQSNTSLERDSVISDIDGDGKKKVSKKTSVVDFYEMQKSVPEKASYSSVMEFITDCFAAHWNSILKNGQESLSTIMMRIANRKKFIQRTNDLRAKSLVDYLSSSSSVLESSDLYLFALLIGVQPSVQQTVRKAWSHISTSIYVISYCDRCIKGGFIQDSLGNPTMLEFKEKLTKATSKIVIANSTNKTFDQTPVISARKAIKILEILLAAENPFWSMTTFSASCVEYGCPPPWGPDGVSKLLNLLIFVILYGSKHYLSSIPDRASSRMSSTFTRSKLNSPNSNLQQSNKTLDWSAIEEADSPQQLGSSSEVLGKVGDDASVSDVRSYSPSKSALSSPNKLTARSALFRSLDSLTNEFWTATMHKNARFMLSDKRLLFEYLIGLHKSYMPKSSQPELLQQQKKGRLGFIPLTTEDAQAFLSAIQQSPSQFTISLSELALVCIHCWQAECQALRDKMSKGTINVLRRNAIAGYYDSSQASMTAVERLAMTRILHWYNYLHDNDDSSSGNRLHIITATNSNGGISTKGRGMNWDDVQLKFQQRNFPFDIPESLMSKSRNELNYLAHSLRAYILEYDRKNALEDTLAEAGPYSKHSRGLRSRGSQNIVFKDGGEVAEEIVTVNEIERFHRGEYLKAQSLGSNNSSNPQNLTVEIPSDEQERAVEHYSKKISKTIDEINSNAGTMELNMTSNQLQAVSNRPRSAATLSARGYQSPEPIRLPINLVDVIDSDANILSKVGLLSRPASAMPPQNGSQGYESWFSGTGVPTPLEIEVQQFSDVYTRPSRIQSSRGTEHTTSGPIRPTTPGAQKLLIQYDNYNATVDAQRKANLTAARLRVQSRIENSHLSHASDSDDNSVGGGEGSGCQNNRSESRSSRRAEERRKSFIPTNRYAQYLDLKQFVDKNGNINIDLKTHMSVENPTKVLVMKDLKVSQSTFTRLLDSYLKPKQLEQLVRLDVSDNRLALDGALSISLKLRGGCCLVHLNLNGMDMGDMGLKVLFNAMIAGGGQHHLLRLDVQKNGITLATQSFKLIANFTSLRALDLSNNCITLDTSNQITIFCDGITPLDKLESLSLAGNKIQDRGFEIVQRIVINNFPNLKLLDLAGCFISSLSYSHLANLLGLYLPSGWPRLDEILFQNNLLNHTHYQELLSEFGDRPMRCKFSPSSAYTGIESPLRYNLRDFGVDIN